MTGAAQDRDGGRSRRVTAGLVTGAGLGSTHWLWRGISERPVSWDNDGGEAERDRACTSSLAVTPPRSRLHQSSVTARYLTVVSLLSGMRSMLCADPLGVAGPHDFPCIFPQAHHIITTP